MAPAGVRALVENRWVMIGIVVGLLALVWLLVRTGH
jgi:hypothetical protein